MPLRRMLGAAAHAAKALPVPGPVRHIVGGVLEPRAVRASSGRFHIKVRGVHASGAAGLARAVEEALLSVDGVRAAEVNAVFGRVVVTCAEGMDAGDLVDLVEDVERLYGAQDAPFAPAVPGDVSVIAREAAYAGLNLAACGAAVAGKATRALPLPETVPALISIADLTPWIREGLTRRLGASTTDLVLSGGGAVVHALAQQPSRLALDAALRLVHLVELQAHMGAWDRYEGRHDGGAGAHRADPLDGPERPRPLPHGPVERLLQYAPMSVAASLGTLALTRDAQRAQGVLVSGVPKAARVGREAFAAQFGRIAAGRGVVVCDTAALRRLDRIDTVVVDASALRTGRQVIDEVLPLADVPAAECCERALALVDPARPGRWRSEGGWTVSPLRAWPGDAGQAVHDRARELRRRGAAVLALARDGELTALVVLVPEPEPLAEALVSAAHRAGLVVATGAGGGLDPRLQIDRRLPGGPGLRASVRRLQEEGRGVALVSARGRPALAAADVGIGLLRPGERAPWGADLLCGPGLDGAWLIVDAIATAREVSRRSARIAATGWAAGVMLAASGPAPKATGRALLAVNAATLSAVATGTYSGTALARRPAPVPADRTPWHAWPVQAVLDRLDSSPAGLDAGEAARRRTAEAVTEPARPGLGRVVLEELDNPFTPPLAAGAGISAVMGSVMDAALIGTVLGVNAFISGAQRAGAERALRRLVRLSTVRIRLRRPGAEDGGETEAAADELVPGDVIALAAGDAVPADCRVLSADGLEVDESSLTGESQLVAKAAAASPARHVADRHSMLYQGTVVAAGNASAVVVATGERTEIGRTARLGAEEQRPGGVSGRLLELTRATLPASLAAGAVLFGVDLLSGRPVAQAVGSAVTLAVAAVPEGLPFIATAAELATARRLSRHGALVRNPATVEALGRVDVLCFDKTGTLTEGRLRLRQISDGETTLAADAPVPWMREIVAAALRASPDQDGGRRRLPHPTDRAVMHAAEEFTMDPSEGLGSWERVDELPFEPSRGYHAVLGRHRRGQHLSVKGAPEIVLERCDTWRRPGQAPSPFDASARATVERQVERLARGGYRVLAVAERSASGRADLAESRIRRLRFLGLVGIADPVRRTAAEAVDRLRGAGVQIMMITGDHPSTAEAIAAELGVLDGHVMTGSELDERDAAELARELPDVSVFARVSPAQKARVVQLLQDAGQVVAVTGDGANDAPAIRLADVGIALGRRATPAARETADLVVTDDRIETIVDAIADSRAMWKSARDALAVLLGGNLGEIAFTIGGALTGGGSPLNVRQLLLVNLLTDMLPAIALAVRRPAGATREDLLREGPEASLGAALTRDITVRAVTTAGAAQTAYLLARASGTRTQAVTAGLVALVGTQLLQTLAAGGRSPLVLASGVVSLGALVTIVQVPVLSHFFGCRPLLPHCWAIAGGSALAFAAAATVITRRGDRNGGVPSPASEPEAGQAADAATGATGATGTVGTVGTATEPVPS
ncbi:cation-translocating P-type ATPase [Actinomadura viridis]|uniref:Cation-transporting ATPase I n=1 Tax=Actinomadura viridis TaxID=58110 RepID=A0A931DKR5_9ACTN|nr:HAD-IC family P-type ATPase [Actinomadura viridis]MBG6091810.1 cation-transporting ATPase I [Actinomadura viridis]